MRWILAFSLLLAALGGCSSDPEPADGGVDGGDADQLLDGGDDGDVTSDADEGDADEGDSGPETNIDELLDWYSPEAGTMSWRNSVVTIVFLNEIDPDTLLVEINDEAVDMLTLDDQEYRFVPLPLFEADTDYTVTIVAGLVDVLDNELDGDFSWTFHTEFIAIEDQGDPTLSPDEEAFIMAGEAEEVMDLVTDYDNPDSSLYVISPPLDPASAEVQHLIARMMESVVYHGGIGLAAPQVGVNRRLFVADVGDGFEAFLNPVLLSYSDELGSMSEGCLSVPDLPLNVFRPEWVEVEYDQDDGTHMDLRRLENSGIFAIPSTLWQHEFDHLNGILITDRASIR